MNLERPEGLLDIISTQPEQANARTVMTEFPRIQVFSFASELEAVGLRLCQKNRACRSRIGISRKSIKAHFCRFINLCITLVGKQELACEVSYVVRAIGKFYG
jgi:hypothetical protein